MLFGIGTIKLNLKEQQTQKLKALERERRKLLSETRRAMREGRDDSLDRRILELDEFMKQMESEALLLTRQEVRGE